MNKPNKKELVEFINKHCVLRGKRITKRILNQLSEDELLKIVESTPEIKDAFLEWVKKNTVQEETLVKDNRCAVSPKNEISEREKTPELSINELIKLVDQVIEVPNSYLSMANFKRFLNMLPYGTISFEILAQQTERVREHDLHTAYLLLNYATEQELFL